LNCVVFHGKESSRNFIIANEVKYLLPELLVYILITIIFDNYI